MINSIISGLLSIGTFIIIFSIIVLVHEFGHFIIARLSGVKVLEFALGMGPRIYSYKPKSDDVEYVLNAIPLGGYVRMLGEEEDTTDANSFEKASLWHRIAITIAGIVMNLLLTIAILTVLFTVGTRPFLINDDAKSMNYAMNRGWVTATSDGYTINEIKLPIHKSIPLAITETGRLSAEIVKKVGSIPSEIIQKRAVPEGLSGPVGIADITHKIRPMGFWALVKMTALLSLSLAVMNILPLPALDGGRLFFQLIELITGKRSNTIEMYVHYAGFILLMLLFVIITANDIRTLITEYIT